METFSRPLYESNLISVTAIMTFFIRYSQIVGIILHSFEHPWDRIQIYTNNDYILLLSEFAFSKA